MMFRIRIDDKEINLLELLDYPDFISSLIKNSGFLANPFLYSIIKTGNSRLFLNQTFKAADLSKSLNNALNQPFKTQIEDDINQRLDILRYLLKFQEIELPDFISILIDLADAIFSEANFISIVFLKYAFLLYEIEEMEFEKSKLRIDQLIIKCDEELKKLERIKQQTNSELKLTLHYLLIKHILSIIYSDISIEDEEIKKLNEIMEKVIELSIDDLETFELITSNMDLSKRLKINNILLFKIGKVAITNFLRNWIKYNQKSLEQLLVFLALLINLSIYELDLRINSGFFSEIQKTQLYPGDFIYFFDDSDQQNLPKDIKKLIFELETTYNLDCKVATQILIRKIIEASFYIKAEQTDKLDEYKNDNREFKRLKEIPKIAKNLNFINKKFMKDAKRLISLGDIGTHNYKIIQEKEMLKEEIENLRMILLHIFHSIS